MSVSHALPKTSARLIITA